MFTSASPCHSFLRIFAAELPNRQPNPGSKVGVNINVSLIAVIEAECHVISTNQTMNETCFRR